MKKGELKKAVDFHGHLGPYLVLGLKAGELALRRIRAKKYFGIDVEVRGAGEKPKSCLVDGLQLSTGATFGKGNIQKKISRNISIIAVNKNNRAKAKITLKNDIIQQLKSLKKHSDSERLAKILFKTKPSAIFNFVLSKGINNATFRT